MGLSVVGRAWGRVATASQDDNIPPIHIQRDLPASISTTFELRRLSLTVGTVRFNLDPQDEKDNVDLLSALHQATIVSCDKNVPSENAEVGQRNYTMHLDNDVEGGVGIMLHTVNVN